MSQNGNTHFSLFGSLPPELRLKIWHFAAVSYNPRVIEVALPPIDVMAQHTYTAVPELDGGKLEFPHKTIQEVPPMFLVSREARAATLSLYKAIKIGRMEVKNAIPFRAFRPGSDIIYVAESASARSRIMRPHCSALFPLECILECPQEVRNLHYVAIGLPLSELAALDMALFISVLRNFEKLEELHIIQAIFDDAWTCDELRKWGADVPQHETTLFDPDKLPLDCKGQLEDSMAVVNHFNRKVSQYHSVTWTPVIKMKYCVRGT